MSYYSYDYWRRDQEPREESEKAWIRSKATEWDERWQKLSHPARLAYLIQIKAAAKQGSQNQPSTPATQVPAEVVQELVAAGLIRVEPGLRKKPDRLVPEVETLHFSTRIRSIYRYQLLGKSSREDLAKFVKFTYYGQGESLIARVLSDAGIQNYPRLEEGLENYLTTWRWPGWAADSTKSPTARSLLDALIKAPGPVREFDVPSLVPSAKPRAVVEALESLLAHLAVFEDLDPKTLDLIVGVLPVVRERIAEAARPRSRPPLIVADKIESTGPIAGTSVNDLRVFLLEVAGESPRLRRDGGIFQKEIPRFQASLSPWPDWLKELLGEDDEGRVLDAYSYALSFDFVETEADEKQVTLRLTGKGRRWMAASLEEQYQSIYESLRTYDKNSKSDYGYGYSDMGTYGDALFLGVQLTVSTDSKRNSSYYYSYTDLNPEQRQAQRDAIDRAWRQLKVGEYYLWQSVLDHIAFEGENPLVAGRDASKLTIFLQQRPVSQLPERQEEAGKLLLLIMLTSRLIPFDAIRPAIDDQGRLCVARLPRLDGYFGRKYDAEPGSGSETTRVIVQPDFSVVVIGLDPAPAADLAPFCERTRGHLGEGAITFRITRASVIRAASQGLSGKAIVARLQKHASVGVPDNVLREVREWADWVRLVNVRQVMVVRCPDSDTVARVVAALGKKAARLGDNLVELQISRLTTAERDKLQSHGIIVTKDEIEMASPEPAVEPAPVSARPAPGKRARSKKAR